MPNTPSHRTTRSNSATQNITLQDIKTLIETSKTEIVASISCEIVKLNETVSSLLKRIDSIERNQIELERRCKILEEKTTEAVTDITRMETEEILNEVEDRHAKRKFLIISGLPECKTGSPSERRFQDAETISELIADIGIDQFVPEKVARIGPLNQGKPRLLRFKCSDTSEKFSILRHAKNLRNNVKFPNIYINPDLTYIQRQRNKALREELKRRREAGENVRIRRGVVVESDSILNFHLGF